PSGDHTGSSAYPDRSGTTAPPSTGTLNSCGAPSLYEAMTTVFPVGDQAGLPRRSIGSVKARRSLPSSFVTQSRRLPRSSPTEKAMRRPSGAIAGPPTTRAPGALHSSVPFPSESFQMPSPPPVEETYTSCFGANLGERPPSVGKVIRVAADQSTARSEMG